MATFAYIRASTNRQVAGPVAQKRIVEAYCRKLGIAVDGYYVDPEISGDEPLFEREAGRQLMLALRKGDHVVVARFDRLGQTLGGFATLAYQLLMRGVGVHALDLPGEAFLPGDASSVRALRVIVDGIEADRRNTSTKIAASMACARTEGRRYTRHAPYGYRWQRTGYDRNAKRPTYIKAPNEDERTIMRQALALHRENYSYDQIRQYLNYEWKVRNRLGGEWTNDAVRRLIRSAEKLLASEPDAEASPGDDPKAMTTPVPL
jgi:DNA invertase Pin-like site-specific DNA recombinase